jgi:alkylation response protein AidB-like acyl-CoA dehydrogenase
MVSGEAPVLDVTVDDELLTAAARASEKLRRLAPENERARELVPESLAAISADGLGALSVPRHRGGAEAPYASQERIFQELARGCPSSAWVAYVYASSQALAGLFPDDVQDEILDGPTPRIAGTIAPTAKATPARGGWTVTGRWPFNTGCRAASWAVMSIMGPDGPFMGVISYDELEILDDWHTLGLRGTGSYSAVANEIFVSSHRTIPLPELIAGTCRSERNRDVSLVNIPLIPLLSAAAAGASVGVARGALEAFLERLPERAITTTIYSKQADATVTHLMLAEATTKIDLAAYLSARAAALADRLGGEEWPMRDRVQLRADVGYAIRLAKEAVQEVMDHSGASAIRDDVPIQRYLRDIQVLSLHAGLLPTTNLEMHGRVLAGLEPQTPHY